MMIYFDAEERRTKTASGSSVGAAARGRNY